MILYTSLSLSILFTLINNNCNGASNSKTTTKFDIYWNIPTFMCHKHKIYFNVSKFGIIQNIDDKFRGENIVILYDPGEFPAYVATKGSKHIVRNGGLPQLGNVSLHLNALRKVIKNNVPDEDFSGVGVIDFESWRPILRQNWGTMKIYQTKSHELEKSLHPTWTRDRLKLDAKIHFEHHARIFMQKSLELVREMRPRASWGYYAFPYCFNYVQKLKNQKYSCPREVKLENNQLSWLFETSDVLYPSLYMSRHKQHHYEHVHGRLVEARRLAKPPRIPLVIPYVWYLYQDQEEYLTVDDLLYSVGTPKIFNQRGVILWGSSNDVNTTEKCLRMYNYVEKILGPTMSYIIHAPLKHLRDVIHGKDFTDGTSNQLPDESSTQESTHVLRNASRKFLVTDGTIINTTDFTEYHTSTMSTTIVDENAVTNVTLIPPKEVHPNILNSGDIQLNNISYFIYILIFSYIFVY